MAREPPLVRPKSMFSSQAKAWESVAKQSGLKPSQVTASHTDKAWCWKRKKGGSSKGGGNPGGKKKMANKNGNKKEIVNTDALGYGAAAGGISQLIARMTGPTVGPLAAPLGVLASSMLAPDTPRGRDVAAVLQTTAGAEFGAAAANWIPVPQVIRGSAATSARNGQRQVVL